MVDLQDFREESWNLVPRLDDAPVVMQATVQATSGSTEDREDERQPPDEILVLLIQRLGLDDLRTITEALALITFTLAPEFGIHGHLYESHFSNDVLLQIGRLKSALKANHGDNEKMRLSKGKRFQLSEMMGKKETCEAKGCGQIWELKRSEGVSCGRVKIKVREESYRRYAWGGRTTCRTRRANALFHLCLPGFTRYDNCLG